MNDFDQYSNPGSQPTQGNEPTDLVLYTGENAVMNWSSGRALAKMHELAKTIASSEFVPPAYQGKPANCLIALDIAMRFKMAPFEVFQNLNVIYGKPTFRAQWQVARLQNSGLIKGGIEYEYGGATRKERWCVAHVETVDGKKIRGPKISYALAEAEGWTQRKGSKWPTMTDLMLSYRAASWLISQHFPQATMGIPDTESVIDVGPVDVTDQGSHVNVMNDAVTGGAPPPLKTKRERAPEDSTEESQGPSSTDTTAGASSANIPPGASADTPPGASADTPPGASADTPPGASSTSATPMYPNADNAFLDADGTKFDRAAHATSGGLPRKDEHGRFVAIKKRPRRAKGDASLALATGAPSTSSQRMTIEGETIPGAGSSPSGTDHSIPAPDNPPESDSPPLRFPESGQLKQETEETWEDDLEGVEFD